MLNVSGTDNWLLKFSSLCSQLAKLKWNKQKSRVYVPKLNAHNRKYLIALFIAKFVANSFHKEVCHRTLQISNMTQFFCIIEISFMFPKNIF